MGFLSMMGHSFGCSASGERLVSAARDGDLQEAKAILDYNPRLARYSTFGLRNSPLHYSASQGHHEIVFLLLESGVNIDLRNTRGQTALMQACQYGHWEVVQTLMLFKANINRTDFLNGGSAIHFASTNGHSRCVRLVLADYIPSIPDFWNVMRKKPSSKASNVVFDESALISLVNKQADGGVTAVHMAALNGHAETVELLLDLGARISEVTVEDGTTIDLIGAGSTPLHYAACGGNAQCCQILISRGASLTAKNIKGSTPLMVAISWHRHELEGILSTQLDGHVPIHPSPYLSLPLMSVMKIARKYGWREADLPPAHDDDPCVVCLERKCTVAAEGCEHEFCTRCALYLCITSPSSTVTGPPGAIACPLCRHAIVSFLKLTFTDTNSNRELQITNHGSSLRARGKSPRSKSFSGTSSICRNEIQSAHIAVRSASFRHTNRQNFPSMRLCPSLCLGAPDISSSLVSRSSGNQLQRSVSNDRRLSSCFFALTSA